ncbi:hypothetical protein N0V91_009636 [Didymella pomorum]|uniref:Uncharacterized protein n=1 Tax=Didymella pomorum TaxID=749634 RepID=A0A9W8Z949_9PLEO|nr:hypothetical protein N0V91_009636 [Didymella pomorum]
MPATVADGYATIATDAGAPTDNSINLFLLSPGNLNMLALQNFAYVALHGYAFAQRYADIVDGIYAAVPAINAKVWVAEHFPQQVMNELNGIISN